MSRAITMRSGAARNATGDAPSWRERLAALRHVPPFVRLVWATHRGYCATVMLLRLVRAGGPVASLWIGKLVIDAVVDAARRHVAPGDATRLWRYVLLELAIVLGMDLLQRASQFAESALGELFSNGMSVRLMQHAASLDLAQFEDPTLQDRLERATGRAGGLGVFTVLLQVAQDLLSLGSFIAALSVFDLRLLALLVLAILPTFLGELRFAGRMYALYYRRSPERRQLDYLRMMTASPNTAKEIQLFGLAPWLVARFREVSMRFYRENRALWGKMLPIGFALTTLGTAAYYGAYALILTSAVAGRITLGTLTFLTGTFQRARGQLQGILGAANNLAEQALYLSDMFAFLEIRPTIVSRPNAPPVPRPMREGFRFENVGFRYPGSDRWAVRGLNLTLGAGERIALVGENGAGKTTIVKLLARLYDPTEGRVLLDGVDLREWDLASLRAAVGVIFQDFVRYDLRFDENVGVGQAEILATLDGADTPPAIVDASERALATTLLPRLTDGYRQMLGRRFAGGVDLSGGEWQKVALARAYLRDAQVLVLDEPTAALDARAEYEVFQRFAELVHGRTALLISHRFSTVRMADRIVVLRHGAIEESGTHDVLLGSNGLYAELFAMQAEGYR